LFGSLIFCVYTVIQLWSLGFPFMGIALEKESSVSIELNGIILMGFVSIMIGK